MATPTTLLHEPPGTTGTNELLHPVLVSVPHAGTAVPAEDAPLMAIGGQSLLRDADLHVEKLVTGVPALGVTVLQALVSRYVLDVNRAPDDVDRDTCPDIPRPARPSARGLCWRLTTEGQSVLRRPLTLPELSDRRERVHTAYHTTLERELHRRRERFGYAILLDMHSMPSTVRTGPGAQGNQRRADVVPGDVRGTSCSPNLSRLVADHFAHLGYRVRPNDPYMGGYITRHHGRPARGIHAIQVELNRDLYMNEATYVFLDDKAAPLKHAIEALVRAVCAMEPPPPSAPAL